MKKNNQKNSDIQNRFTAYLVTAIQHTKIEYGEKKRGSGSMRLPARKNIPGITQTSTGSL